MEVPPRVTVVQQERIRQREQQAVPIVQRGNIHQQEQ
jgi:hypothetical protein